MRYVVDLSTGAIVEEEDAPPSCTKSQLMSIELAALATEYKATTQQLQLNWLTAVVNDGTTEETKKSAVLSDISAAKSKYVSDIAAIKAKYT